MPGHLIIIPVDGRMQVQQIERRPDLKMLQKAVGGHIQLVPLFDCYVTAKGIQPCVAYCNANERGDQAVNLQATERWRGAWPEFGGNRLYGPVVILAGQWKPADVI
ncbi:hypothetical protein [Paracoccus sp. T5]|uniref:hypothetical protein n=1 Tax=Paracoccus sp. T5 TaxID=3402161 RepID=UPI003AD9DA04